MPEYKCSKIYKIVDKTNDNQYYGATTEPTLARRLAKTVQDYKTYLNGNRHNCCVYQILENNNYEIILVEKFPCNSKDELHAQLAKHIRENECINKVVLGRTRKEYREDNKEVLKEKRHEYYEQVRKHSDSYKLTYCKSCKTNIQNQNLKAHISSKTHYLNEYSEKQPLNIEVRHALINSGKLWNSWMKDEVEIQWDEENKRINLTYSSSDNQ